MLITCQMNIVAFLDQKIFLFFLRNSSFLWIYLHEIILNIILITHCLIFGNLFSIGNFNLRTFTSTAWERLKIITWAIHHLITITLAIMLQVVKNEGEFPEKYFLHWQRVHSIKFYHFPSWRVKLGNFRIWNCN